MATLKLKFANGRVSSFKLTESQFFRITCILSQTVYGMSTNQDQYEIEIHKFQQQLATDGKWASKSKEICEAMERGITHSEDFGTNGDCVACECHVIRFDCVEDVVPCMSNMQEHMNIPVDSDDDDDD